MLSSKFVRPAGFVVGAGTALTAFGLAAPAQAAVDCSTGVTVNATEIAIREAIGNGETLICVNPGTIDMSSSGADSDSVAFNVDNQDLHLVALGEVILDGGGEADHAIMSFGGSDEDLTIDGFTITNFSNGGENDPLPAVLLDGTTGTLTILNSTFIGNSGYGVIGATDFDDEINYPDIVIDNSHFEDNATNLGTVWGYAYIDVGNSSFINDESASGIINHDAASEDSYTVVHGNFFSDLGTSSSALFLTAASNSVYNNTFVNNIGDESDGGSVITFEDSALGVLAFNTFAANDGANGQANVALVNNNEVVFHGNVFDTLTGENGISSTNSAITDGGGNISTSELDSAYFDDATSVTRATTEDISLGDPADNGGSTWTMALGEDSIARDVLESSLVANELGPDLDWDQRGEARGDLVDAGAWDDGESGLASTGVDAAGIALTGGLIGAAGAALVVRRRRKA